VFLSAAAMVLCLPTAHGSFSATGSTATTWTAAISFAPAGSNLYATGANSVNELGVYDSSRYWSPEQTGTDNTWTAVDAYAIHTCGIKSPGSLWCWGGNDLSNLGTGAPSAPVPAPVQIGTITTWTAVSVGGAQGCALRAAGTLWCWGYNASGEAGQDPSTNYTVDSPTQVGTATNWASVGPADPLTWPSPQVVPLPSGTTTVSAVAAGSYVTAVLAQ
jgi:alpha-tubulin suppressor-like RCC1 family protein